MKKAIFKLPKMKTKIVWYGSYGGHYDCIIFFKKKPTMVESNSIHYTEDEVDLVQESQDKNVLGGMWPQDFEDLTGIKIKPSEIEITKVYKLELTAPWDEYGYLWGYSNDADGWI